MVRVAVRDTLRYMISVKGYFRARAMVMVMVTLTQVLLVNGSC